MKVARACELLGSHLVSLLSRKFPENTFGSPIYSSGSQSAMDYRGVPYEMDFQRGDQITFELRACVGEHYEGIEERIADTRISNGMLDQTKYLRNQQVTYDPKKQEVTFSVTLKRSPRDESEVSNVTEQVWAKIIKPSMAGIYPDFYAATVKKRD